MSRIENWGKDMPGWVLLLLGEIARPLPSVSAAMMKNFSGSSALPGPIRKSWR